MPSDTKEVKEILLRASGSKGSQRNHVFICNQSSAVLLVLFRCAVDQPDFEAITELQN